VKRLLAIRSLILAYFCVLLATATMSACTDKKLRDIVEASGKVADTVAIVQKAAVDAETAGTLNREQTRAIMQLSIQISQANNQAMSVARDLSKLDEPSRQQLLTILTPIIKAVETGVNDKNVLGIENAQTREAIRGAFLVIQTSLNSINLILSAGN
jgi:hypothetical protein